MKIKLFFDENSSNYVLNEILDGDSHVVDNINEADVVGVFFSSHVVNFVKKLLHRPNCKFNILVEMTNYNFNSDRVYMINTKQRDPCIVNFKNYIVGLDIGHIDFTLVYYGLNLKAEVMNCLAVVGDLIGWGDYENKLKLRFSYNDHSVHVSGYIRERNFTLSIFISNMGTGNNYVETLRVYTKHNGIFTLDSDNHCHTYGERYGAAIQKVLEETKQSNNFHQLKLGSVIKSCCSGATAGNNNLGRARNRGTLRGGFRKIK